MGRLQGQRIRPVRHSYIAIHTLRLTHSQVTNRAWLARLDVLHGRQATNTRRPAEGWTASMGAAWAETEPDGQSRRVQTLLHR